MTGEAHDVAHLGLPSVVLGLAVFGRNLHDKPYAGMTGSSPLLPHSTISPCVDTVENYPLFVRGLLTAKFCNTSHREVGPAGKPCEGYAPAGPARACVGGLRNARVLRWGRPCTAQSRICRGSQIGEVHARGPKKLRHKGLCFGTSPNSLFHKARSLRSAMSSKRLAANARAARLPTTSTEAAKCRVRCSPSSSPR